MLIWIPGILRAPCTLAVGYSVGLLGGRPEGTTLTAGHIVGVLGDRFICKHTPLIFSLVLSCNFDFVLLMPII